ncbi:M48 family metalloprotease [Flavobacteriaceae bacterium TP-CH-4]|uniref:M48 family metalloprotease n=1 Tax=Pelagihabitans pacificus TaxID=2696054 RepID=A0A967ARD5_9FLAO|nr:M48 family metallopeptidase [Pelagihabitans pacificus]NHF57805.1 M48 family metalloprotease [Pelagihabitans pacificus]
MTKNQVETSPEFKKHTAKAIAAIFLFLLVYLLLFILTIGLTALTIYSGITLIGSLRSFFGLALGIGLASLGIIVLIFLVKFLFKSNKIDRSHLTEITASEEPALFAMVHEIVNRVGTSFPKKVYLSPEVNAAVFYDSNFWSMFLPVKKNLVIGLGLINTMQEEELKAILAHEFGHFSQRTMKVGSYVYNVNQVIFNMLFENEGFDTMIQSWASASGFFSIFVLLAVKIIQGIQWVLKGMYGLVNKSYLGLSREMEFHADEIASHITGYLPLKNALMRTDVADHSLQMALSHYETKIEENLKSNNIYKEQAFVMGFYAKQDGVPLVNGLPVVTFDTIKKFNKSKLVVEDQWASHPSTQQRIERLESNGILKESTEQQLANTLMQDAEATQRKLSNRLFGKVNYEGEVKTLPFESFVSAFEKDFLSNRFDPRYNGYYDNKNPEKFDVTNVTIGDDRQLSELFSDEMVDLVREYLALENDRELIRQTTDRSAGIKTFDYDGRKYRRKETPSLLSKLDKELESLKAIILQNDINIFRYFRRAESTSKTERLSSMYLDFFSFDEAYDEKIRIYTELSEKLQFINFVTPIEEIKDNLNRCRPFEKKLKAELGLLLDDTHYAPELTGEIKRNLELFLSKEWPYFSGEAYLDDNLTILFTALNNYAYLLSRGYFLHKKKLIDYQISLINEIKAPVGPDQ